MQLGSTEAGAEVRARMQSASLLSDMESFKAANPGCSLADLVRWHSPRDWQEDSGLSGRMKCEGNMWASLWEQARAVPARRQKRLFDDTREAEKVVQWLVGLSPGDAAQLLLPCLVQVVLKQHGKTGYLSQRYICDNTCAAVLSLCTHLCWIIDRFI